MNARRLVVGLAVFVSLIGSRAIAAEVADIVLKGGAVYTVDASRSWAEAVAIAEGRIVFVGTNADAEAYIGPWTRVLELSGEMILPGFHDSHVHPVSGGIELGQCDLNGLDSGGEVFDAIEKCASERPEEAWIVGGGWDLPVFEDANPHKRELDRLVPDRPAYLTSADAHSAWVNSRALELAGVTSATADPPNGRIERDPSGAPTGTLRESAMDLVSDHVPALGPEDYAAGLRRGLEMANRFGITSLVEASGTPPILEAYRAASEANELTARVRVSLYADPEQGLAQVETLIQKRRTHRGARLRPDAVKIFADGVIEAHTAALLAPYVDQPDAGELNWEPELLNAFVSRLEREGFQVHVHAIGDRAVRASLDAIEGALREHGFRDARHQLAHIELFDPDDIPRFRKLGVVADFQPLWAYADTYITDLTEPVLGPERSRWLYPIRSLLDSGAVVAAGSDWSVSSMNPLAGIEVALTRQPLDGSSDAWLPQERADLESMIAAYTIRGAYVQHQEDVTGSIEPGKLADLVILDRNLFDIAPSGIASARVLLTLLGGEVVYRDGAFATGLGR